jgi:hypothetical protein
MMSSFIICTLRQIICDKSKRVRWAGHVEHIGEMRNAYKISDRNREGMTPLGRSMSRTENNIKMDLK